VSQKKSFNFEIPEMLLRDKHKIKGDADNVEQDT
jgi:hypothetical protein